MKKIFSLLLVIGVLLCMAPTVSAAGSAYWSGPDQVRAGDTITLTFCAGGGILGGNGSVSFDSSLLTLQGYSPSIGGSWAVEFTGNNFVFYDNSMASPITDSKAIFSATFVVSDSAAVDSTVSVSATGVTLSDGDQDMGVGTVSYSKTLLKPLSENCNLRTMVVSGATISPAFSPSTTSYSAKVPFTTSSISISATAEDAGAKVSVNNPELSAGKTTTVSVTVTAESGAKKTYSISVAREQDPDYKESVNTYLSSLTVKDYALSPAFSKDVTQYYVWLPYEAEDISIAATAEDSKSTAQVGSYTELTPGVRTDIPVTVTSEDGSTKVYTVTVVRAPAHDKVEEYLMGEREPVPEETEPATEPEPEETEPATEATGPQPAVPQQLQQPQGVDKEIIVLLCVLCTAGGAGILALVQALLRRKKGHY